MSNLRRYVICLSNEGYAASLDARKIYVTLHDDAAASAHMLRVIDESGEDYLYPASRFAYVDLPRAALATFAVKRRAPLRGAKRTTARG